MTLMRCLPYLYEYLTAHYDLTIVHQELLRWLSLSHTSVKKQTPSMLLETRKLRTSCCEVP